MSKRFLIRLWKEEENKEVTCEEAGNYYVGLCPFHNDTHPSLNINKNNYVFGCFGCEARGRTQELLGIYSFHDEDGNILYQQVKCRDKDGAKKFFFRQPTEDGDWKCDIQNVRRVIYNLPEVLKSDVVFVVEGPKDAETVNGLGFVGTTSPYGAGAKWKSEFNDWFKGKDVIVIPDNDQVGKKHALDVCGNLKPVANQIRLLELPDVEEKEDITDWLGKGHTKEELLQLIESTHEWIPPVKKEDEPEESEPEGPPIDTSQFTPMSIEELTRILGLTIVKDEANKLITFLCMLSAYTEEGQFNISLNSPSSTGKTYIPLEVVKLFPHKDVIELGYCSPMAFFHDYGKWDKERKMMVMDLSRKIIIFLDQPHTKLLERLRPLLSHDRKEMQSKITDKTEKSGMRTKNVIIRGFPSVIFCTAGLKVDEQEITRFILLSPDADQEKIREAIHMVFQKEANKEDFDKMVESDPGRQALQLRIRAIKQEKITEIRLHNSPLTEGVFKKLKDFLKPRHMRDASRLSHIIKALALLNLWFKKREGSVIYTDDKDIEDGFRIWEAISEPNDFNLPPYLWDIWKQVIEPLCDECGNTGIRRMSITKRLFQKFKRLTRPRLLDEELIPMLTLTGLIREEPDPNDKRAKLIFKVDLTD